VHGDRRHLADGGEASEDAGFNLGHHRGQARADGAEDVRGVALPLRVDRPKLA
jgi:hypothetical protein